MSIFTRDCHIWLIAAQFGSLPKPCSEEIQQEIIVMWQTPTKSSLECTCRSHLEMSICGHVRNVNLHSHPISHYTTSRRRFLAMEDREDNMAGLLQCTHLQSQVHKWVLNAANGWWLWEKKKQRSHPTVEAKRVTEEKEFNSRKHVLEILQKPGI